MAESKSTTSSPSGTSLADVFLQAEARLHKDGEWHVQKGRQDRSSKRKHDSNTKPGDSGQDKKKGYENKAAGGVRTRVQDQSNKNEYGSSNKRMSRHEKDKECYNEAKQQNFSGPPNKFNPKQDGTTANDSKASDETNRSKSNEYNKRGGLSYTKLHQMSLKDSTDIIRILANSSNGLDEFLESKIKPDMMYLIIKVLKKLTESDWEENKKHVLIRVSTPEFFQKIAEFVTSLAIDEQSYKRKEEMEQFFDNLLTFFHAVLVMLPSVAADHLTKPLKALKMAMGSVAEFQNVILSDNIHKKLKLLMADFEERKKEKEEREKIENKKSKDPVYPKPLGSISDIPLYLRPEDIENRHRTMVPENKIKGPYASVEHYLDVQFRLLREDFIAPVRQGIQEYRIGHNDKKTNKNKRTSNLRIYPRVKFLKPKVLMDKVGYDIRFDPEKRLKVKWEHSKRFIFGSLLIFTTDNFQTFFLATVINRDLSALEKDRTVTVLICDTNNLSLSQKILTTEFLMAESEVYFEPYYNVLRALQRFNSETFPMKKYIVYTETKTDRPAHTRNGSDVYTISIGDSGLSRKTLKLFDYSTWPSSYEFGFDNSQLNAYRAALTNDLVVIQGPPGTGKTYLGLKIAGALLENKEMWSNNQQAPILVLCYTNHALDQFLEGIIEKGLTNNIVRVGGRSKSELLDPFNLRERRKSIAVYNASYEQAALLKDLKKEMTTVFESIKILQDNLEHLNNNDAILAIRTLKIVMNEYQRSFFKSNDDLIQWLLCGVKQRVRSQKSLISTDEKQTKRLNDNVAEFIFDAADFENVARLKEVLFDGFEFDEVNELQADAEKDIRIYFTCTLEEIKKKIEDQSKLLQAIPGSEESRDVIKKKMQEAKKAESDLNMIYVYFEENLKNVGVPSTENSEYLNTITDLNTLDSDQRWSMYKSWIEFLKAGYWMLLCKQEEHFRKGGRRYDEVRQFDDLRIVQQADVVGVTTTSAARLQTMLRELKPKIVIVEEAAEVLEAHIVASLSVYCQHLILIGDHKQLRPSPADYKLGKDYHLEVSLFERLVNNGINFHTLTTQHRMRPEISTLLVPTIYPTLTNHPTTLNRERIRGMDKNIFFMTHPNFEKEVDDIKSKRNDFEARMVMSLARHLLLQGYRPDEITVLTTYSGQMYLLKDEQNRLEISKDLQVTVVDNFQGEENKIILLSLVRSNVENRIGFLKTENRVCVALSRARDGLYVFGNMDCLIAGSTNTLWQRIKQSFDSQDCFGPALLLRCETHRDQLTRVVNHSDFNTVIEGGCNKPCGEKLDCGHECRSLCHVSKDRHLKYRCSQPCNRMMCADNHPCPKKCYQKCGNCEIPMRRTLRCGHQVMLPCCVSYGDMQCKQMVTVRYPECQHSAQVECFRKDYKVCPEACPFRLECGHACSRKCHVNDDPDHLEYVCAKPCARRSPECTTPEHPCPLACFEECEPCNISVVRKLPCGHSLTTRCSDTLLRCTAKCGRTMDCGHICNLPCIEECTNCPIQVEKTVPLCGHKVTIACGRAPEKIYCKGKCGVRLECGHKCSKRCCDLCNSEDCQEPTRLPVALPCGHTGAVVPCYMTRSINLGNSDKEQLLQYCSEPCLAQLSCSHLCSGSCGQCMQGRIHKVCDEDCNNTLICGHSCPVPCRTVCPPCEKNCQNRCIHSQCKKKCGEPCVPCNEPCEFKCPHRRCRKRCGELCDREPCTEPCLLKLRCNHPCVGFCGEPCPPCKQCFPDKYQQCYDIFGGPDEGEEESERWVFLNDCKHVVEATTLEQWLGTDQEGNAEIKHKTCPLCRPTEPNRFIITTQRYMNLVKQTYKDIQMVKEKIFGEISSIRKDRQELLDKVRNISPKEMEGFNKEGDELYSLYKHLLHDLPPVRKQKRKEIGRECMNVLRYKVDFLIKLVKLRKDNLSKLDEQARIKLATKINILTRALKKRNKKIAALELKSFKLESQRIVRFVDFLILESTNEFKTLKTKEEISKCHKDVDDLINKLIAYTDDHDKKIADATEKFQKVINSNAQLSAAEMKMINLAMSESFYGTAQGHWFKCRNGHPYVITECGGAMEEANCPWEGCGARIGGQNHRYLPDQQLASEFDGARRPAWSSGNDMANFDLNNIH